MSAPALPPDPLAMLIASMNTLAQTMNMIAQAQHTPHAHPTKPKSAVQLPTLFKEGSSADARRFLAVFTLYAMLAGRSLNTVNLVTQNVTARHDMWIRAALLFMQDEAALWATPYMEEFANGTVPFNGIWGIFKDLFKAWFETTNEVADAKDTLRRLYQGRTMVAEYLAKFKEFKDQTSYSAADLRDQFYKHLATEIKDKLVHTACTIGTLDELSSVAINLDNRICQCWAEKARETGKVAITVPKAFTPTAKPFTPPCDPNSMDVDATETREAFLKQMNGKCFACGRAHWKQECTQVGSLCGYCGRIGHKEAVCKNKFRGKPKTMAIRSTSIEEVIEAAPAAVSDQASLAMEAQLAALMDSQKLLATQLEAMKKAF